MKKLALIALTVTIMAATTKAQNHTADEAGIKQTLTRFTESWNKNDFSDMKDYMTPDCNWINVVGMHWHNLKEVQFAHQTYANTMFKGVKLSTVNVDFRFLTADIAIVYSTSHIEAYNTPDGHQRGNGDALATIIFVKQKGKWMIASAENVDINKEAGAHDPVLHMNKQFVIK